MEVISTYPWLAVPWQKWGAYRQQLGHAYLVVGDPGVGMEPFVNVLAQSSFCDHVDAHGMACQKCSDCQLFTRGQHPDFYHLERLADKKEIAIDQVRELTEKQAETAHQGGRKVVWIDGVERLSISAFNALLKTLEEPMGETVFLLSTAQLHRLPATIKSRCQQLSIATPSIQQASQWLQTACPQSDSALIKRALRLNWGAPVAAKQWLDSGEFKQHNQWLEQVQAIVAGQAIINPCIDEWLKWPQPMRVLEYFYQATQSQIRQLGYQAQSHDTLALQSWLRFEHALGQAKLQWQGNANPTLIIENVLTLWLQINRHPEQAITLMGTPFESQMIRGEIG